MTEKVNSGLKRSRELHFSVSLCAFTLIIKDHVRVTFKLKWRSEQSNTYCGRIRDITGLLQRTEGSLYLINLFLHVC